MRYRTVDVEQDFLRFKVEVEGRSRRSKSKSKGRKVEVERSKGRNLEMSPMGFHTEVNRSNTT